ncbi:PH domain-containing protein, partial [Weissella confusa]|uniref:PH domain-containing protein n=1 Tax=Weissella confusa TaxID=1583 RepID=UPI0022E59B3F
MGLFDGLMGNATKVSNDSVRAEIEPLLISGEVIEHSYKLVRDLVIFTDKRLIIGAAVKIMDRFFRHRKVP